MQRMRPWQAKFRSLDGALIEAGHRLGEARQTLARDARKSEIAEAQKRSKEFREIGSVLGQGDRQFAARHISTFSKMQRVLARTFATWARCTAFCRSLFSTLCFAMRLVCPVMTSGVAFRPSRAWSINGATANVLAQARA